jgi:hypothetical protein
MHAMRSLIEVSGFLQMLGQGRSGGSGLRVTGRLRPQRVREIADLARILGGQLTATILGLLIHGSVVAGIYATPNQRAVLWLESQQDQSVDSF